MNTREARSRRVGEQDGLGAGSGPVVGEQIIELLEGALRDAREDVLESGERLHSGELARSHEAAQHGRIHHMNTTWQSKPSGRYWRHVENAGRAAEFLARVDPGARAKWAAGAGVLPPAPGERAGIL